MKTVFWIWTGVCVLGAALLINVVNSPTNYTGNSILFKTSSDNQIDIDAESVTMEAASSSFFVLRRPSGESIVGVPMDKPLGWSSDEYYFAREENVPGGLWLIEKGSGVTLHITSESNIEVSEVRTHDSRVDAYFFISLMFFFLWLLGLLFGSL